MAMCFSDLDEDLVELSDDDFDRQGGHDDAGELLLQPVAQPHEVLEPADHHQLAVVEVLTVRARVHLSIVWCSSRLVRKACLLLSTKDAAVGDRGLTP